MPVVSFSVNRLKKLTQLPLEKVQELAFEYGLEAEIKDNEFELEVTAERPDLLSPEGFTRVINTFTSNKVRSIDLKKIKDSPLIIRVSENVRELRPYIGGIVVEELQFNNLWLESMIQHQDKASQTFGRQRKKISVGIYNLSEIKGNISYRAEKKSNVYLVPLNSEEEMTAQQILEKHPTGVQYASALPKGDFIPVLRDESGKILSIPPIINAHGVGKVTPNAKSLFIDVTGTSEKAVQEMLSIIAHDFIDAGAKVSSVKTEYPNRITKSPSLGYGTISYSLEKLCDIVGINISEKQLREYLLKMDLIVNDDSSINFPSYRTDIIGEVDIAGDLLVAVGLQNIKPSFSSITKQSGKSNKLKDFTLHLGDISQLVGLAEVKSLVLTDPMILDIFNNKNYVETSNSKSRSFSTVRTSLQPGLIEILSQNITKPKPIKIYEVGEIASLNEQGYTKESIFWAFSILGTQASFSLAKSYIQTVLKALKMPYQLAECNKRQYIDGRAASIKMEGNEIGHFGEIHPIVLEHFSFPEPVCSGEIDCNYMYEVSQYKDT